MIFAYCQDRTEILHALLAAPGINGYHADVSIYPLTPSHAKVVGVRVGVVYFPSSPTSTSCMYPLPLPYIHMYV